MLQTTQADQSQSLQQELAIFHALLTESKTTKKKSLNFCKNLNAYTHYNTDKTLWHFKAKLEIVVSL